MTRDEVIKALEFCVGKACFECPLCVFNTYVCKAELIDELLELLRDDKQLNDDIISTLKQEPKRGRWITCNGDNELRGSLRRECSECGEKMFDYAWMKYCPICGARMEADDDEM